MMEFILQPWPWYVAGPLITLTMLLLYYFGKRFGVSSNLETICAMTGAGKINTYFKFDWRANSWNLVFVLGSVVGGFIAYQWLSASDSVAIGPETVHDLQEIGFTHVAEQYLPPEIFSLDNLLSLKGILTLLIGGFLIGFGARYAGGCTSGHAIVGLSNLQLPSLVAVIGFFVGGLVMTWLLIPLIF